MFAGEPVPDAAYVNVFVPGVYVKIVKVPLKIPVPPVTPSIIIVAPGRRSCPSEPSVTPVTVEPLPVKETRDIGMSVKSLDHRVKF
jgi:hypothetical protein